MARDQMPFVGGEADTRPSVSQRGLEPMLGRYSMGPISFTRYPNSVAVTIYSGASGAIPLADWERIVEAMAVT